MPKREIKEEYKRRKMFDLFIQASERILHNKYKEKDR